MALTNELITVEVAYATPLRQVLLEVEVAAETRVADVIERSGILQQFPEIEISQSRVGIFSRLVNLDTRVEAGDRIEIYRALVADPKIVRMQRVAKARKRARSG